MEIPGPDGAEDESLSIIPACGIEEQVRGIAPLLRPLGPHDPDQVLRQIAKGYPDDPRIDLKDFRDDPAHPAVLVRGARTGTLYDRTPARFGDPAIGPVVSLTVAVTDPGGCAETRPKK